jgi:hypothetical protein
MWNYCDFVEMKFAQKLGLALLLKIGKKQKLIIKACRIRLLVGVVGSLACT